MDTFNKKRNFTIANLHVLLWESFFFKDLFFNDHDIGIKVKKKRDVKMDVRRVHAAVNWPNR
jgi:hypothetical protein